jgi:hypothetical protein
LTEAPTDKLLETASDPVADSIILAKNVNAAAASSAPVALSRI